MARPETDHHRRRASPLKVTAAATRPGRPLPRAPAGRAASATVFLTAADQPDRARLIAPRSATALMRLGRLALEVTGGAAATYTCRLEHGDEIPTERFDCVICTQTLQLIYDLQGALRTLHRILKPGGYLLLTVQGITPIHHGDDCGDAWHWTFTTSSISRLCSDLFGPDSLEVEVLETFPRRRHSLRPSRR
jgi:SAM-dependent methyltransferase